jgi:hypothetical protein
VGHHVQRDVRDVRAGRAELRVDPRNVIPKSPAVVVRVQLETVVHQLCKTKGLVLRDGQMPAEVGLGDDGIRTQIEHDRGHDAARARRDIGMNDDAAGPGVGAGNFLKLRRHLGQVVPALLIERADGVERGADRDGVEPLALLEWRQCLILGGGHVRIRRDIQPFDRISLAAIDGKGNDQPIRRGLVFS